jgi:hypothetical protein
MKKLEIIILGLILLFAFSLRLYKLDNPIADWHSWRQADTAAVTRNFEKKGLNLLQPTFDDLSNIPSGLENPRGYRMVEFPIFNLIHYWLHSVLPQLTLEQSGRLTSIFSSLFAISFLYFIAREYSGKLIASIAALMYAVIPFFIYYSRVILPEQMMVTATLGAVWLFIRWAKTDSPGLLSVRTVYLLVSAVLAASALLLKPTAGFMLLLIPYITLRHLGIKAFKNGWLYIYLVLTIIPVLWWRQWIQQFPAGIPAYTWLLNGDNIRWRPAWFRWLFYERLTKLILGGFGATFFFLGIPSQLKKTGWFELWWLGSLLLYLIIFATGNVRHDYYQIILGPLVSLLVARGIVAFWQIPNFNKLISIPLSGFLMLLMLFISWYEVRGYYQINNPGIVEAGQVADQLLPADAQVIASYQGDTAFLYQTNRPGWPMMTNPSIDHMINLGATHYVSVNFDELTKQLMEAYEVVEQNQKFIILNLHKSANN